MFRTFDSFWDTSLRDRTFRDWDRLSRATGSASPPALDVVRYDDRFELVFDLPGADPDTTSMVSMNSFGANEMMGLSHPAFSSSWGMRMIVL